MGHLYKGELACLPDSPGNLTLADIQTPLWHEAHAPLWFLAAVCAEVMHVGRLVCDLKVPDAAVALQRGGSVTHAGLLSTAAPQCTW